MVKRISTQICNIGGSSLSDDIYETPYEICLSNEKESIGENVTQQICNAGGSDLSHGFLCSAGFSEDSELDNDESDDDDVVTICKYNRGK